MEMGGKGTSGPDVSPMEWQSYKMAKQLWDSTTGLRSNILGGLQGSLSGDIPASLIPQYQEGRRGLEGQYGVARENILSSTPTGGGLTAALNDLETNRANAVGGLKAATLGDLYNTAQGVAFNMPSLAFQGMGQAGQTYAQKQSAQMGANAQAKSGKSGQAGALGMGLGRMMAGR